MTHAAHHPDDEAVDRFAAELKAKLADARAKGRGGWEDKAQVSAQALSDMLLAHVFKGDPRDVANFAMFLHQRGESIALADGPRMEHAVEVFQIAEQRCAEHHAGAGRLIEPGIAVQAGLIAAAPFLIGAPPAPVAGGYRGVSWRANGEANSYHLLRGGRWLAHILMNGELFVGQQTDMMERIVIALGGPAQHGGAAETALRQVAAVIQRYQAPAGISKYDAISEIIGIVQSVPLLDDGAQPEAAPNQWKCKSCGCDAGIAGEPYWTHGRTQHAAEAIWRCDRCDATHEVKLFEPTTEAQTREPHASLEDLRTRLLAPRDIVRDPDGWLSHPDMPVCDESVRYDDLLAVFGIETAFVSLESQDERLAERYFEESASIEDWNPEPPAGDGWVLLEIYDTENGPYAIFGRAMPSEVWPRLTSGTPFDFHAHLVRQAKFSRNTFGPGRRTQGVSDHIRKELAEIAEAPDDLEEWIDVVILALDGAWRTGASPEQIIATLKAKQAKNEARTWPDWRTADPNKAIEHSKETAP